MPCAAVCGVWVLCVRCLNGMVYDAYMCVVYDVSMWVVYGCVGVECVC